MLKKIVRKMVQGLATAFGGVSLAAFGVSVLWVIDGASPFGWDAALRVGIPAFVIGTLFFPVNEKTLASRSGFALRAGLAAATSSLVHRALLWSYLSADQDLLPEGWVDTLQQEFAGLSIVLAHPSVLIPVTLFEPTFALAVSAIAVSALTGFIAQPMLLRIARGGRRRLAGVSPISPISTAHFSPLKSRAD